MSNELLPSEFEQGGVSITEPLPAGNSAAAHQPVASYRHTALMITLMVAVSILSAQTAARMSQAAPNPNGPFAQYLATIVWLWVLAALAAYGMRKQAVSIREVIGTPWRSFDDALMDFVIAAGFWIISVLLLASARFLVTRSSISLSSPDSLREATKHIAPLLPHSPREIIFWILMSVSAGLCEEFVFRGYLQRQFTAMTKNAALGIFLSAIIFSVGHLYQGGLQMASIGAYGAMFGVLAFFRRSLRPGMIAHAWQDILSGVVLGFVVQHVAK